MTASVPDKPRSPEAQPDLHFPLQDAERVLMIVRRHWLYLYPRLLLMGFAAILPPIVVAWLMSEAGAFEGIGRTMFLVLTLLYVLYWGMRIFLTWYRYNNDIWVITNQRVIDSLKMHPFSLKLSSADLVNVQDMTIERDGVLRTIFDFGDILCQTASETADFRLSGIPDPRGVQALVDRERDRERTRVRV